jgi:hypothetical protein
MAPAPVNRSRPVVVLTSRPSISRSRALSRVTYSTVPMRPRAQRCRAVLYCAAQRWPGPVSASPYRSSARSRHPASPSPPALVSHLTHRPVQRMPTAARARRSATTLGSAGRVGPAAAPPNSDSAHTPPSAALFACARTTSAWRQRKPPRPEPERRPLRCTVARPQANLPPDGDEGEVLRPAHPGVVRADH